MAKKKGFSLFEKWVMYCPIPNILMFIVMNIAILLMVARGHGGTRENK